MRVIERNESDPLEALDVLGERDDASLNHAQQIGLEYLRKNLRIKDRESFEELRKELAEIDSLKDKHVLKLLEILPEHEEEVQAIFSKERVKLDDTEIQDIVDICRSYTTE